MLLELINVKKFFPISSGFLNKNSVVVKAVNQVTLSVKEGENLGVVGESGSGKTTLARLILKLYNPDSGRIILDGKELTILTADQMRPLRRQVQMIFQDPYSSLDPRYTIRSILNEALSLESKKLTVAEQDDRMVKVLRSVELPEDSLERFPHEFSGGERQRIAIARALLMQPRLLLLDEAVSSLDVLVQTQIIELLKRLQRNYPMTYIFISHNLRVVRKLCHRIAVMYKGKIIELARTEELFRNPLHPYTRELLAAAIDYKAVTNATAWSFSENSSLREVEKDHFVIH